MEISEEIILSVNMGMSKFHEQYANVRAEIQVFVEPWSDLQNLFWDAQRKNVLGYFDSKMFLRKFNALQHSGIIFVKKVISG